MATEVEHNLEPPNTSSVLIIILGRTICLGKVIKSTFEEFVVGQEVSGGGVGAMHDMMSLIGLKNRFTPLMFCV